MKARDYKTVLGLDDSPGVVQPTANDPQEPMPLGEVKVPGVYWVNWAQHPPSYELALIDGKGYVHEMTGARRCIPIGRVPGFAVGPVAIQPK